MSREMTQSENFAQIIDSSSENLPLVIQNLNTYEVKKTTSGKIIQIKEYRTKLYSVNVYPKNVTRFIR